MLDSAQDASPDSHHLLLADEDMLPSASTTRADRLRHKYKPLFLLKSYATDWIVSLVLAGIFFWLGTITGFRRRFSLDDKTIQFPYAVHERVPNFALALISTVAPFVLIPVVSVVTEKSLFDIHNGWLGLIVSLAMAGSITNIVKVTVGRPRPDLIDRCQPASGALDMAVFGLVTDAICTQTSKAILDDGWRSFPSGHSSLSFAGLGFLTFYVAGKMHLWDKLGSAVKAWISIVPLIGAALVAVSRTMDYRHHWQDVLGGSILGITVAYFAYRQYYPSLDNRTSGVPHSPLMANGRNSMLGLHAPNGPDATERGEAAAPYSDVEAGLELSRTTPPT